jgi:hypothetical protein
MGRYALPELPRTGFGKAGFSGSWTTAPRTGSWAAADRFSDVYPNAWMIHLPVHASWLNQVYFSVI